MIYVGLVAHQDWVPIQFAVVIVLGLPVRVAFQVLPGELG